MSASKLIPILSKSIVSGVIAGVGMKLVFGAPEGAVLPTFIGELSVPVGIGLTVGLGQLASESLQEFVLDPSSTKQWDDTLMGFLNPALAAGSAVLIPIVLWGWKIDDVSAVLKVGALGAASVIGSDYLYDNFIAQYIE